MTKKTRHELLQKINALELENTLLREKEKALSLGEKYIQEILDNIPAPIYLKDAQSNYNYLMINKRYEELAQVTLEDIVGKNDFDIFPQSVAALFRSQDEEVLQKNIPVEFEETIPLADGIHTFITSKFPLHDRDGVVTAVGGFCTDITERMKNEWKQKQLLVEIQESRHKIEYEQIKFKNMK